MFEGLLRACIDHQGNLHILKMFYSREFLEKPYTDCLAKFTLASFGEAEGIAGIGRKGGYLGSCVARSLKKPFISVNPREGSLADEDFKIKEAKQFCKADRFILIDDTMSSGFDCEKSKELLRDNGFHVLGSVILVWDDINGKKRLDDNFVRYVFRLSELNSNKPV
jgi:adenine/guanine phosphoribosyltransferase-like PRPP-binding protein